MDHRVRRSGVAAAVGGALFGFVVVFLPGFALLSLVGNEVLAWAWFGALIAGPAVACHRALRAKAQPAAGWTAVVFAVVLPVPGFFALAPSPAMFVAAPLAVAITAVVARGAVEVAIRARQRHPLVA